MAEIILIKVEKGNLFNYSEYWNIIKYRVTAETPHVNVHVACIVKGKHII